MISLLLSDPAVTPSWTFPILLLVLFGGYYFYSVRKQKRYAAMSQKLVSELKVGDKVKTYAGFYGTIVQIETTAQTTIAILKTGNETFPGYISVDINAIYALSQELEVVVTDEVLPDSNDAFAKLEEDVAQVAPKPKTSKSKTKKSN